MSRDTNEYDVTITVGKNVAMGGRLEKSKIFNIIDFKKLKIKEIRQILNNMLESEWTYDHEKFDI